MIPFKITTFGCAEYLCHKGLNPAGELEFVDVTPKRLSMAQIKAAVCARFNVPPIEMTSARRKRDVARPRQVAMYLCRQLTPRSLPEIGKCFGDRDHTTVSHACRQIERLRREDPELAGNILAVELSLLA